MHRYEDGHGRVCFIEIHIKGQEVGGDEAQVCKVLSYILRIERIEEARALE